MTRWMFVLSAGCLIVGEPGEDAPPEDVLPIGEVHPCTIQIVDAPAAYWTICFQSPTHITDFTRELMDGCEANGTRCTARCEPWSLRPCLLACPSIGFPRGCNASHGCYCPPE